jgi:hypothetical protein
VIRRNQKSTIKGHLIHSMSVQHGRVQRQLYDTEKALYRFQYTEGRAMAPAQRQHSIGKAFGGLVLLSVAGIISTYGVYSQEQNIMWIGFSLVCMVFVCTLCSNCHN